MLCLEFNEWGIVPRILRDDLPEPGVCSKDRASDSEARSVRSLGPGPPGLGLRDLPGPAGGDRVFLCFM